MTDNSWTPIHHEDAAEEVATVDRQATKPNPDKPKTDHGLPIPMAMSLLIPPDFIAALSATAGALSEVASEMGENTRALRELIEEIKRALPENPPVSET